MIIGSTRPGCPLLNLEMSCSCVCGPFDSQQGKFSLPSSQRSELEVLSAGRTLRVVGKTIFCVSHLMDTIMRLLTVSSKVLLIIWHGAQVFVDEEKCNLMKFNNLRQPNVKQLWGLNAFFLFQGTDVLYMDIGYAWI